MQVEPYVSLNREPFALDLVQDDLEQIRDAAPFHGDRPWSGPLPPEEAILIDDLDQRAQFDQPEGGGWLRRAASSAEDDLDQGLPGVRRMARGKRWVRWRTESAAGRYRHTAAIVYRAGPEHRASLTTSLPQSGAWQLEWHSPDLPSRREPKGGWSPPEGWQIAITQPDGKQDYQWKPDFSEGGWHVVETFELQAGEVTVSVGLAGDSGMLLVDAVRWRPVAEEREEHP